MTTPTKEQILFNLATAYEYLEDVPENKLDLKWFKQPQGCGTLMCAAGWLTEAPHFKDKMALYDALLPGQKYMLVPAGSTEPRKNAVGGYDWTWLDPIFGPNAFDVLFSERFDGMLDEKHPSAEYVKGFEENVLTLDEALSDKALALWRIEQQIERVKAGA